MAVLIVGAIAVGVAMMANNNDDSAILWGIVTFVTGIVGAVIFGFLGALIGSMLGAGIYAGKMIEYG